MTSVESITEVNEVFCVDFSDFEEFDDFESFDEPIEDTVEFIVELIVESFLLLGKLAKLGILLGVSSSSSELSITATTRLALFILGLISSSETESLESSPDDDKARFTLRKFPENRAISA